MKLRYKIGLGFLAIIGIAVVALGVTISYTKDCPELSASDIDGPSMIAWTSRCYGSPDVLRLETLALPDIAENEVLVRVSAAGVNPLDWHYMRGSPYLMRLMTGIGAPEDIRLGRDFAGTVAAIGSAVTDFSVGDRVYGGRPGAFGEYVVVPDDRAIAKLPDEVSFEQAAGMPIAAITALQALRDKGGVQAGDKVLINGASGGVGTYAVQLAKTFGAEVTGVCSTRNVELVKSLGADHVIDYKTTDYTKEDARYDLIVDNVGNHSPGTNVDVLVDDGKLVSVGGLKGNWIAPLVRPVQSMVVDVFVDQELMGILAQLRQDDLAFLAAQMAVGRLRTNIDKRFSLEELPEAIRYSESGRARGKIILDVGDDE